jgi:hypothetical protein
MVLEGLLGYTEVGSGSGKGEASGAGQRSEEGAHDREALDMLDQHKTFRETRQQARVEN